MGPHVKMNIRGVVCLATGAAAFIAGFCIGAGAEERRMRPWMSGLKETIEFMTRLTEEKRRSAEVLEAEARDEARAPAGRCLGEPLH
jgi:hypothetical protein